MVNLAKIRKSRKFYIILVIIIVIVLSAAGAGIYAVRYHYAKTFGIDLTPSQNYPIKDIVYYTQNDPEWSGDSIGNSSKKMGGGG